MSEERIINIVAIRKYWDQGLSLRQILDRYPEVTSAEAVAILHFSSRLSFPEIRERLAKVKADMTLDEIRTTMKRSS